MPTRPLIPERAVLPSMVLPGSAPGRDLQGPGGSGGGVDLPARRPRRRRHGQHGDQHPAAARRRLGGRLLAGFRPPPGQEAEPERRQHAVVTVGDQDADSRHGLGGYHGSARVTPCNTAYYAVGVYSEAGNGIPIFDQPWKNVAATIYHQLNEARTDPDVDDVTRTGDSTRLGWYSAKGGEIGDIPVKEAGTSLALVFREVDLADGSGAVPVQLMWSNKAEAPPPPIAQPPPGPGQ